MSKPTIPYEAAVFRKECYEKIADMTHAALSTPGEHHITALLDALLSCGADLLGTTTNSAAFEATLARFVEKARANFQENEQYIANLEFRSGFQAKMMLLRMMDGEL